MGLEWYDLLGLAGVAFVIGAFFLLQAGKLEGRSLGYQLANLFGAAFVLVSLVYAPNLSAIAIQVFWIVISAYGIVRGWRQRHPKRVVAPRD